MNLYTVLESGFPSDRSQVCLEVPYGRDRTWEEIEQGSARIANWLCTLNLPIGSRVASTVEKSPEALMLYLATIRAGLAFLPLNTAYRDVEIEYFFGNAKPSVVVFPEKCRSWLEPICIKTNVPHFESLNESGSGSLIEKTSSLASQFTTVEVGEDALASILYTSGTTGRSKGAMLTHGNLASNAQVLHKYWEWSGDDVLLHMLPIFHIHGLFVAVNGALLAGAKMVWLPKFEVQEAIQSLPRCTMMMGVPTFYVRLLNDPRFHGDVCKSMRLFVSGSAPLLIETFTEFQSRTGFTILERYGMSETGMLCSNPYSAQDGDRFGGTVGKPLPGVSLRITNDEGNACRPVEIGMIEVKGPGIFHGYWEMPEKTQEEFSSDGYFRTGDLGQFGGMVAGKQIPNDYVSIIGRGKDLIISGGLNVYPKEIEGFLDELPGIEESAVVGVPHPDFGEVGIAFVVKKANAEVDAIEILAILKSRIANFKIPKQIIFVSELPRNTMGKVQKNVLRARVVGQPTTS